MRSLFAISLGGLFVLGCGGGGAGLSAGNAKPKVVGVEVNETTGLPPQVGSGLELTPDIADEKPSRCDVTWTLKVWDGGFLAGQPRMIDVDGTYVTGGQAEQTSTGESAVVYDVIRSGWYTVVITVRDADGASQTTTWDFTLPTYSGQWSLLPVGDASDSTDPIIDVTEVVLKGQLTDVGPGNIQGLTMLPPGTVNLATTGTATSDFDATIDCAGIATPGSDIVTMVIFTATDEVPNTSQKEVTITEHLVP